MCKKLFATSSLKTQEALLELLQANGLVSTSGNGDNDEELQDSRIVLGLAKSKRHLPYETLNFGRRKKSLPFETLNYGKRSLEDCECATLPIKRSQGLPYETLLYGKRHWPVESLQYGKRAHGRDGIPVDGYILGKRSD